MRDFAERRLRNDKETVLQVEKRDVHQDLQIKPREEQGDFPELLESNRQDARTEME